MINGLKVTVPGGDIKIHLHARQDHHRARAEAYQTQVKGLDEVMGGPGQPSIAHNSSSSPDPRDSLRTKVADHKRHSEYFAVLAKYIDINDSYLLDQDDLRTIEMISTSRW